MHAAYLCYCKKDQMMAQRCQGGGPAIRREVVMHRVDASSYSIPTGMYVAAEQKEKY